MFKFDYETMLYLTTLAMIFSAVSTVWVQKTKGFIPISKLVPVWALLSSLGVSFGLCYLFTDITWQYCIYIGIVEWLGAEAIYQALDGKLKSHDDILKKTMIEIPIENNIREEV